jgi:hypothetical protein
MEFEDLQAIWDTQNDKPVFAIEDARLLVALYQQREHRRRRLFRREFAPMYAAGLVMLVLLGLLFFAFLMKSIFQSGKDFPMSAWDGVAFAVAVGAVLAIVVPMYVERKENERTQNVFAPSLREELDRGITHLDFELHFHSPPRMFRTLSLLSISVLIILWETERLNGNTATWRIALPSLLPVLIGRLGLKAQKRGIERLRVRRRALESMRAALDADKIVLPRK